MWVGGREWEREEGGGGGGGGGGRITGGNVTEVSLSGDHGRRSDVICWCCESRLAVPARRAQPPEVRLDTWET